jgi:hypothetical protein
LDSKLFQVVKINSWEKLLKWAQENKKRKEEWVFRGLRDSKWGFETSLERAIKSFGVKTTDLPQTGDPDYQSKKDNLYRNVLKKGLGRYSVDELERGLLRKFKRQCHHYLTNLPEEENDTEWLALMQHYGAPTRILDLTHSLFVGLYFALEQAEGECAVWALDLTYILGRVKSMIPSEEWKEVAANRNFTTRRTFDLLFRRKPPVPLVCPIIPYRFNDRLVIQQGMFLCPGDVSIPFEDNLTAILNAPDSKGRLIKLVIKDDSKLRKEFLQNLYHMNMNSATLFPGLSGFAQSLRTLLVFPDILSP